MWLSDLFLPAREDRFLSLLDRHVGILTHVSGAFRSYVNEGAPSLSDDIDQLEKEADDCLTELTTALRDAFVTPIDRQDIYNLGEAIDDMIDYFNNASREISLFKVSTTDQMRAIAGILDDSAGLIAAAVRCLKSDPPKAWERAREAQHCENLVEDRYRQALAELFDGNDMHQIFKLREVYRHLSNCADRADAIGRLIGKIVIKAS
jgi:predicted phosphate transport protein (TIGR00153 family)